MEPLGRPDWASRIRTSPAAAANALNICPNNSIVLSQMLLLCNFDSFVLLVQMRTLQKFPPVSSISLGLSAGGYIGAGQGAGLREEFANHLHSCMVSWVQLTFFCSKLYQGASLGVQTVKNLPAVQETGVQSLDQEDPLEKGQLATPLLLPGESHGQRSLVGYGPWCWKELDMTEWLATYQGSSVLSLSCGKQSGKSVWTGS